MDGAGRFTKMRHIALPGVLSAFMAQRIMNIGYLLEAGFEIQRLMGQNVVMDWSKPSIFEPSKSGFYVRSMVYLNRYSLS